MTTTRRAGKTALVAAAGQGVGRAIAKRLIAKAATVHASNRNGDLLVEPSRSI